MGRGEIPQVSVLALYDNGFTDLVCVAPPGAQLSPGTALDPADVGKAPAVRGGSGWHGYDWRHTQPTLRQLRQWESWGSNVGLRGDRFPALDIDVDDEFLARAIAQLAQRYLGPAPVRRSAGSRRLLPYRTEAPFARLALRITHHGVTHMVELLGSGRQYLVAGTHPSGQPYRWEGPDLSRGARPEQRLALITLDRVQAFYAYLTDELRRRGLVVEQVGHAAAAAAGPAPEQETLRAPSLERLEELVARIPNREDRDGYVRMGHAIKAAGGEEALCVFAEWASRWEDGHNDAETVERDYAGFRGPYRLGWDWLVVQAEAQVLAQDEFQADPDATPPVVVPVPDDASEDGVSRFLLPALRERLRFIPAGAGAGSWLVWEGHRWVRDETLRHRLIVGQYLRGMCEVWRARAAAAPSKGEGKAFEAAAKHYSSDAGVRHIVSMLQPLLAARPAEFDLDAWALNTPDGLVNLRTGERRASAPSDLVTRSTAVAPRGGPAPLFAQFLEEATGGDVELQRFIQRMFGYALVGDIAEKHLWTVWGEADTGKSTFVRVINGVFGDYADTVDIEAFIGSNPNRIPADLARLPGVRLVTATEPPADRSWDEKRIKAITGGDAIEARFLYGQPFIFKPQFKVVVVGNHEPEIKTVDSAMLRRIQIVPLNVPVPRDKQVANLSERIIAEEGPQVLQWLLEGCAEWQRVGLLPPACVQAKTAQYGAEQRAAEFLTEECVLDPAGEVSRQELFDAWTAWCRRRNEQPGTFKAFRSQLQPYERQMGFHNQLVTARRVAGYSGLKLKETMI
jgi:putative DNA primase/helicase